MRLCSPASIPSSASTAAAGPTVVTSLNLKLYGVREDRATGRGSAIIALPDGRQMSFAVGEEVMPGVTLTAVGFDNVTISRNGTARADLPRPVGPPPAAAHSRDAGAPQGTGPQAPVPMVTVAARADARRARRSRSISCRGRSNGHVTGIIVSPGSDGGRAFGAAGFARGRRHRRDQRPAHLLARAGARRAGPEWRGQCDRRSGRAGRAAACEVEPVKRALIALCLGLRAAVAARSRRTC